MINAEYESEKIATAWILTSSHYQVQQLTKIRLASIAGNSGHLTWVRQQPQEQHYTFLPVSAVNAVFLCLQTVVWLPVFGIFNMRPDFDACNCTPGL